jgi:hypothetical protein
MDDSLSRWLRLREPADSAARSEALTRRIADTLPAARPVYVLDLATGTGSNIRYLAPRLPGPQRWLAVDRSAALLAELRGQTKRLECDLDTRQMDLGTLDPAIFAGRHLVTASALLDLVSETWLRTLAAYCRAEGASALFAITYNGRSSCDPAEPGDEWVRDLLNRHQKRDKGLGGPAAGPAAVDCAARAFVEVGYRITREASDWTLGPAETEMQRMLIDGWAEAAVEIAPDRASTIASWRARRLAHLDAGRSRVVVGHDDFGAWLPRATSHGDTETRSHGVTESRRKLY